MSITIASSSNTNTNIDTGHALLTAKKVQDQQELEGQLAMKLIEGANVEAASLPTTASSGHHINVKV
ncbi:MULTISPECIES: cytoplasmic protein [Thalassotalea]|uniref:Cytoplasmic protein n=1 Tax=Thalassotalea castellviae TaxID=3075612 RepID=A0ABU2ZVM8_9GAMM|nr:cytoplasmic protein [Thalassotalea sp. W431]MDT0601986.1 cytoplasmic protein [Thalassotalea sp. W431]